MNVETLGKYLDGVKHDDFEIKLGVAMEERFVGLRLDTAKGLTYVKHIYKGEITVSMVKDGTSFKLFKVIPPHQGNPRWSIALSSEMVDYTFDNCFELDSYIALLQATRNFMKENDDAGNNI